MRLPHFLAALAAALTFAAAAQTGSRLDSDDIYTARNILSRARDVVLDHYFPRDKVGPSFEAACTSADAALGHATDLNEAYTLVAGAIMSVDPRIRFYPPLRAARADYGWRWRLIGDSAYVTQLDHVGDAVTKGLKLGDKILSIEGLPLNRGSYQQLSYLFNTLAPRPGLNVLVQSAGGEPRPLAIAATLRPQRRVRTMGSLSHFTVERVLTETEKKHLADFKNIQTHLHRVGDVLIWKAVDLRRRIPDIADGLKKAATARALILDLRGQYARRSEPALRLLDGLFATSFVIGTMGRDGATDTLRVHGGAGAFKGTVLVLLDSRTACYAELFARVIQQRQRGVLIGDHTMGRIFEDRVLAGVMLPRGKVTLADGTTIDGHGVAPDLLLLPQPTDLAGQRDVVLAKALKMLKQTVTPEDAFKILWIDRDDDEEVDD